MQSEKDEERKAKSGESRRLSQKEGLCLGAVALMCLVIGVCVIGPKTGASYQDIQDRAGSWAKDQLNKLFPDQ